MRDTGGGGGRVVQRPPEKHHRSAIDHLLGILSGGDIDRWLAEHGIAGYMPPTGADARAFRNRYDPELRGSPAYRDGYPLRVMPEKPEGGRRYFDPDPARDEEFIVRQPRAGGQRRR